ncbi:MAG TPA: DNA recombination protein RmuC [Candidatus Binatia bacterium]|nr:DNA recombination protein RmuC [Candidatus Binatia bacterium]
MLEIGLLAAGVLLGGALGWAVARVSAEAALRGAREGLQSRLAAAESRADELTKQLTQRDLEGGDLRGALETERSVRTQAETRLEAARESLAEQKALLDGARAELTQTFKALSADALKESQRSFLTLADERLNRREQAVDALVRPLHDALRRVEGQTQQLEAKREGAYATLQEQLKSLGSASDELRRETTSLVTALRGSQVRGRWGELTLHRVVELAGLAEHCDFEEQVTLKGEGGALRPDMVVHLPGQRDIVVDAKVSLSGYLDALETTRPEERNTALMRHAGQMRQHMNTLGSKAYSSQFATSLDLVVMFVPGEAFVAAAVEQDPALIEDGINQRVIIATPTTLIALLRAIAYGWKQERLASSALEIRDLGRELYERLRTLAGHVDKIGVTLGQSVRAYNDAVGSLESRVLPKAREFRDLGAGEGDEIKRLKGVEQVPRPLAAAELTGQLSMPETDPDVPA